ncbi:MAG: discoidin domain-containing protein [Candidatus Sumerlaeaceae bacterium]|nr:discoidin domain-containing protein [Candidatus Sumerlaeaceae bacterium]
MGSKFYVTGQIGKGCQQTMKALAIFVAVIMILFDAVAPKSACAEWVRKRLIPVAYESCSTPETIKSPEALWDGKITLENKWTCFHLGLSTEQSHYVAVDLGNIQPIAECVVYHEGYASPQSNHLNTEDLAIYASSNSLRGPWTKVAESLDNTRPVSVLPLQNIQARYLKLEIADPCSMNSPGKPNDDWAARILEWEISGYEWQGDGTPAGAMPSLPASTPVPAPAAERNTLYFVYLATHQPSRDYYSRMVLARDKWPAVMRFNIVPVEMQSEADRARALGVFRSPAFVIARPDGTVKATLPGIAEEAAFLKFLDENVR